MKTLVVIFCWIFLRLLFWEIMHRFLSKSWAWITNCSLLSKTKRLHFFSFLLSKTLLSFLDVKDWREDGIYEMSHQHLSRRCLTSVVYSLIFLTQLNCPPHNTLHTTEGGIFLESTFTMSSPAPTNLLGPYYLAHQIQPDTEYTS